MVSFAALTGDWHPQHTDARWASRSVFGRRIAHGFLVLSYAAGLIRLDPERVVALRGVRKATFRNPVPIGDTIAVAGEVTRIKEVDDGHALVRIALQVLREDDETAASAELDVLWRIEPTDGDDGRPL